MRADASASAAVSPPGAAVSLRAVSMRYGSLLAVDAVDLDIERGEVFGLIGHNGAGKSTLMKAMLGLVAPSAGTVRVDGASVDGAAGRAVRRGIGYLPENVVLWDNLSGLETLRFLARLKGAPLGDCAAALARVGLEEAAARPVREYSRGMRQRLGFAQALLGNPRVLFLDEPTSGLDPHAARAFWETLFELRERGVTAVVSSHVLAELQHRVDRLAVLSGGRLQAVGSVQALRAQRDLPLAIRLRLAPSDVAEAQRIVAGVLAAYTPGGAAHAPAGAAPVRRTASGLSAHCPRAAKVALLQALAPLGARLLDVEVSEPTLEDLFFGEAAAGPGGDPAGDSAGDPDRNPRASGASGGAA